MSQTTNSNTSGSRLREVASLPLLVPVWLYRKLVSPFIAPRCRYYPSCSTYAVDALRTYGPFRGGILAAWRVVRCNPFSDGGFDYIDDQKLFKHRHHAHGAVCENRHKQHGAAA
jgi:putative membrane protein insertion efficiency factor